MKVYISASSLSDFISCSQKVFYRINKPFKEIPSREMKLGIAVHKAIELGWNDKKLAEKTVEEQCKKLGLSKTDFDISKTMINNFFSLFRDLLKEEDLVEQNFKLSLYDDVYLVGKMDRISGGSVFDWKTGKLPRSIDNSTQCMVYEFAYNKLYNKSPTNIFMASLIEGRLVKYNRNDFYVTEIFEKIIPRMVKTIRENSYERVGMFNHSCFRCQFKQGCLGGIDELDSSNFIE